MKVPLSALFSVDNVPKTFQKQHAPITVQGLLASFMANGDNLERTFAPWASTWPTVSDFRKSMPLCWPQHAKTSLSEELLDMTLLSCKVDRVALPLPPAVECPETRATDFVIEPGYTRGLLQQQRERFRADWDHVSRILPGTSFQRYLYHWLLVNTRSLYYEKPNLGAQPRREDRIVMCPYIDLFNHNDVGVSSLRPQVQIHTNVTERSKP